MTFVKNNLPLSYIELSKNNLIHNFKQFKSLAKPGTKFSVAIKGNAYGHGEKEVAKVLEPYVDYFQVDSVEELKILRQVNQKKCLLFGYVQKTDLQKALKLQCILTVFSVEQLQKINQTAEKLKIKQEIHIPVDAYLGREGFLFKELPALFNEIKKCTNIKLSGMYAHFANIEDTANPVHAHKQVKEYRRALELAKSFGFKNLATHISATSGLLAYEKSKGIYSLIRLGIGMYGLWPSTHLEKIYQQKMKLKPVLTWKTKVAQIKTLPRGSTIGYGLTYKTKKETKIAIVPQGYADGFDRGFSNKGEVLICGCRCKVLGRVSMNMFAVDVSHFSHVSLEDEVVLLGCQGKEKITAEELAAKIGTINYEITTRVSTLLPRVVV